MAQIIAFPTTAIVAAPSFTDWMRGQFPGKKWVVVKARKFGGKFSLSPERHALLLQREYTALEAEYERRFGVSAH